MRRQFHMASGKEAVKTPLKMTKSSRPATKRTRERAATATTRRTNRMVESAPSRPDRLLPSAELPAYTFVPGTSTPHPVRDPRGHSHNRKGRPSLPLTAENWADNRTFCCPRLLQLRLLLGSPRRVGPSVEDFGAGKHGRPLPPRAHQAGGSRRQGPRVQHSRRPPSRGLGRRSLRRRRGRSRHRPVLRSRVHHAAVCRRPGRPNQLRPGLPRRQADSRVPLRDSAGTDAVRGDLRATPSVCHFSKRAAVFCALFLCPDGSRADCRLE